MPVHINVAGVVGGNWSIRFARFRVRVAHVGRPLNPETVMRLFGWLMGMRRPSPRTRPCPAVARVRPRLEPLGDRIVPAVRTFHGLNSTAWADAGNWAGSAKPAPGDSVLISDTCSQASIVVDGSYGIVDLHIDKPGFVVDVQQPLAVSGWAWAEAGTSIKFNMKADVTYTGNVNFRYGETYERDAGASGVVQVYTSGTFNAENATFKGVSLANAGTLSFGYAGEPAGSGTVTFDGTAHAASLLNTGDVRVWDGGSGSVGSVVGSTSTWTNVGGTVTVEDGTVSGGFLNIAGPAFSTDAAVSVGVGGTVFNTSAAAALFSNSALTLKKGAGWFGDLTLSGGSVTAVSDGVTTVTIGGNMTATGTTFQTSGPNPNRVTVGSGAAPPGGSNTWSFNGCTFNVNVYTSGAGDSSISKWVADAVALSGTTTVNVTRVSGAGGPTAGTWFAWLDGTATFSGSDPSAYTYTGSGLQHRKTGYGLGSAARLELNFESPTPPPFSEDM